MSTNPQCTKRHSCIFVPNNAVLNDVLFNQKLFANQLIFINATYFAHTLIVIIIIDVNSFIVVVDITTIITKGFTVDSFI